MSRVYFFRCFMLYVVIYFVRSLFLSLFVHVVRCFTALCREALCLPQVSFCPSGARYILLRVGTRVLSFIISARLQSFLSFGVLSFGRYFWLLLPVSAVVSRSLSCVMFIYVCRASFHTLICCFVRLFFRDFVIRVLLYFCR